MLRSNEYVPIIKSTHNEGIENIHLFGYHSRRVVYSLYILWLKISLQTDFKAAIDSSPFGMICLGGTSAP